MNLNNRKKSLIFLFSVIATLMLITLFINSSVLLTDPGGITSLGLLIKPVLAADDDKYGLNTTANKAYGEQYKTMGDVSGMVGTIIGAVLALIGVIFLGLMVYGGVLWMTARGKEERITQAKEIITSAFIGIVIVLAAYAITYFVMQSIAPTT